MKDDGADQRPRRKLGGSSMQDLLNIVVPIAGAHIVILVAIVIIIRRLLLSDTMQAVEKIRRSEAEVRKKEETIRQEIEEHEKEFEAKKSAAEEDLEKRREESSKEVAQLKEQILAEARKEADRITDQAKKNEARLRDQIEQEVEHKAVENGVEVFKLVFSERITQAIDRLFIGELLDALRDIDSASISVDATEASFTTSRPLETDLKQEMKSLLKEKFGVDVQINEQIDESLVSGLVMKLGSLEIDGSLRNRCQEAAEEIKKN